MHKKWTLPERSAAAYIGCGKIWGGTFIFTVTDLNDFNGPAQTTNLVFFRH